MSFPLSIEPHNDSWSDAFQREAALMRQALGAALHALHHIGSTAVPGIYAKPVIDILAEVDSLDDLDQRNTKMEELGYEVMGEFGIPGRRYFRKSDAVGTRTHHVHAFVTGSSGALRHLALRDYLRRHPDVAREYGELKLRLLETSQGDMETYIEGKDAFVKEIEREAVEWYATQPGHA